jgi:hypothetical protein
MFNENCNDQRNEGFEPGFILAHLRRLRSAEPESIGFAREIRADREAQSLAAWFDERGLLSVGNIPPQTDPLTGGEHFVEVREAAGLVFKATKPGKFGFGAGKEMILSKSRGKPPRITVELTDATPDEYLARLAWQNELFGDAIRVLGMAKYPNGVSILPVQPFVWGERTEQNLIDEWFQSKGWRTLPEKEGSFYSADHDLLILDAFPRNVLTQPDGTIFPFDVVIVRPDEDIKWSLKLNPTDSSP